MDKSPESNTSEAPKTKPKAKRKVSPKKKSAPKTAPIKATVADPKTVTPKRKAKAKLVLLNTLGQMLEVSILSENGTHTQLRLEPQGKSDPLTEKQLTPYTQRLISRGYIRVVNT
jgi:hypothetical protein